MTSFTVDPGPLAASFARACTRLEQAHFASALWSRDLSVWKADEATTRKIGERLGWLQVLDFLEPQVARLRGVADTIRGGGFTDIVLLGMGGSSLAPEVLRRVIGVAAGFPRFRMLDSVDPDAVRDALANASQTLFVLASKSGSTIEPNVMAAEAQRRLVAAGHTDWGSRFIAITDEKTALHRRAIEQRFREVFVNPSDIGGRYSALSFFGMVPAALMGLDLEAMVRAARRMEVACRLEAVPSNPGLALGALMAAGADVGRDKLTLLLPSRLESFGLWVEQLVAESTGKQRKGIVPIAAESSNATFGSDRLVVAVALGTEGPDQTALDRARSAGTPIVRIEMGDVIDIGEEFLRWEVATATAGWVMGINPFDEPNVQQAKDATRALLDAYAQHARLPFPEPHAARDGVRLTLSETAVQQLAGESAFEMLPRVAREHDYLAVLAYLPPDDVSFAAVLHEFRATAAARLRCASMFGYGPRYLHSTGQLHKGGPNTGVFVVIAAEPGEDLPIPGEAFTFGVLEKAQALGDFQSLDRAGRRAVFVHLPNRDRDLLQRTLSALLPTA